mmetsp:Transcript_24082/g.54046  ORF Transcript_24082/g.54046 Transcript_24082/m.54046 type:complete len:119 (+) Transcript_24082:1040-1396(+)
MFPALLNPIVRWSGNTSSWMTIFGTRTFNRLPLTLILSGSSNFLLWRFRREGTTSCMHATTSSSSSLMISPGSSEWLLALPSHATPVREDWFVATMLTFLVILVMRLWLQILFHVLEA